MNGHINETAPPLVPIGEVKLVQVQIVVWFVRTCEVWILFVLHYFFVFVESHTIFHYYYYYYMYIMILLLLCAIMLVLMFRIETTGVILNLY